MGISLVDSPTMKVVLFVAFILLKLVSARDIPAEPEVQEVMPSTEVDWPGFSTEKIQDKVDQIANEALYQNVQEYLKVPLDWIAKYTTSPLKMTKAGNGMVRIAAETAPYVVALSLVAGVFYLIL